MAVARKARKSRAAQHASVPHAKVPAKKKKKNTGDMHTQQHAACAGAATNGSALADVDSEFVDSDDELLNIDAFHRFVVGVKKRVRFEVSV